MKNITIEELTKLLKYIDENHSPTNYAMGRRLHVVKYVDTVFDNRTRTVFSVNLRGFGTNVCFSTSDPKYAGFKGSLYGAVMEYLQTPK